MRHACLVVLFGWVLLVGCKEQCAAASPAHYGAARAAALADAELTLPVMLTCALQDEYLAHGEYRAILKEFGSRRPFSNISQAEERHIAFLLPLFKKHGVALPSDRGAEMARAPETLAAAMQAGVAAEEANIKMYERFLARDLPADVRSVFEHLLGASRNHLRAFQGGRGGGAGRGCGGGCGRGRTSQP